MSALFSIIVSNFNNSAFLEEMLDSIFEQSYQNWELIIVDDCSVDDSWEILNSKPSDDRITLIKHDKNLGPAACINLGIKSANGEIIGRLDSDDTLEANALEEMVLAHQRYPAASLICSNAWEWNGKGVKAPYGQYSQPAGSIIEKCTIGHFATWKNWASEGIPPLDESLRKAVDLDLYLRLEEQGDIIFLDVPLYNYRIHDGGISQGSSGVEAHHASRWARHLAYKRRILQNQTPNLTHSRHSQMMVNWYLVECRRELSKSKKLARRRLFRAMREFPRILLKRSFWLFLMKSI